MNLFDLLRLSLPELDPQQVKVHLAQWDGIDDPFLLFSDGRFPAWQCQQGRRNFERPYVLSLIARPERGTWMFAGVFRKNGAPLRHTPARPSSPLPLHPQWDCWVYALEECPETHPLAGRCTVSFRRSDRASYPYCERIASRLMVVEIARQSEKFPRFPGYRRTHLTLPQLRACVALARDDWRIPLASVAGVYLIVTPDGEQYVGSASGAEGLWGRWSNYAATTDGGNKRLIVKAAASTSDDFGGWHFSILETADSTATREEVLARESHWKKVLGSRAHGLNVT